MAKKPEPTEETYRLTLLGLIGVTTKDLVLARKITDDIELYLRRHHSKGGHPAIVYDMDKNEFDFVTLQHKEE